LAVRQNDFSVLNHALERTSLVLADVQNAAPKRRHTRYLPRIDSLAGIFKLLESILKNEMKRRFMPHLAKKNGVKEMTFQQ
jgi:hypothetical protein